MCGPYFFIHVEVDGPRKGSREILLALFDTGGGQLAIDPETVARVWDREVTHGEPVKLTHATAGPMRFGTLKPRALSMTHLSRLIGREIDLFVSFKHFRGMLLTLDYPRREMRVAEGRLPEPDGVEVFDARGPDKRPYLSVVIGGRERPLLVDSGSSGTINLRDGGFLTWDSGPLPISATQGMQRVEFRDVGRLDAEVTIAGIRIPSPIVTTTDGTELIGTRIMERFAWTFDRRARRLRARPSSTEPLELDGKRGTGAVLAPTDEGYEVVRVLEGSPAADAGLRIGDLVVARDHVPIYGRGCARWDEEIPDEVTFTVLRQKTEQREKRSFDVTVPVVVLVP